MKSHPSVSMNGLCISMASAVNLQPIPPSDITDKRKNMRVKYESIYLAKYIPLEIWSLEYVTIEEKFMPEVEGGHPRVRLKRTGNEYSITRKSRVNLRRSPRHCETTVRLTRRQFERLSRQTGKYLKRKRFKTEIDSSPTIVDIFEDALGGLVLIAFGFDSTEDWARFIPPDCCLVNVTQEKFITGAMLAGKSLIELRPDLDKLGYKPLWHPNAVWQCQSHGMMQN